MSFDKRVNQYTVVEEETHKGKSKLQLYNNNMDENLRNITSTEISLRRPWKETEGVMVEKPTGS